MKRAIIIIFLCIINPSISLAQETIVIVDGAEEYLIDQEHIRIYKDVEMALSPKEILQKTFTSDHIDFNASDFKTSNYWLKFTIRNNSKSHHWLLEILDFGIERVAFYDVEKDTLIETGYSVPFAKRTYEHKNFVFNLDIAPNTYKTYLVKVSSSIYFGPVMKIRSHQLFNAYSNNEYLFLGLYYGLLILIVTYSFFLYISFRDTTHLLYILYVAAIGLKSLQWDGLGFQYLWPSFPLVNTWMNYSSLLLLISFSIYAISFLELRTKHTHYYKLIGYSIVGYLVLFLIDAFFPIRHLQLLYLLPFVLTYAISILVYRKGYKPARFFVLGFSLFIASQFFNALVLSVIHLENKVLIILFVYSLNIGFILETFIFSMALSDKIKLLKNEKDKAQQTTIYQLKINEELKDKVNRELEYKISERTKELEEAKATLQEQAERINRMNIFLDLENFRLKRHLNEIHIERGLLKGLSLEEFSKAFPDELSCFRFMEELKWGDGFTCCKCAGQKYTKVNVPFARRCTKCQYIETIKANTLFHNVKFSIEKAFQMIYLILASEKEISTYELAKKLQLQQKTCWAFRQKITEKIDKKHISKKDLMEQGWAILIKE